MEPEPLQLYESPLVTGYWPFQISFDAAYTPQWEWNEDMKWWSCSNPPLVNATCDLSGIAKEADPPYVTVGRIYFRCRKDNAGHKAVARKALGLIRKMATNKCMQVQYPSMEVRYRVEKGGSVWIGEDAVRWCRANPQGMVSFQHWHRHGLGFRPLA